MTTNSIHQKPHRLRIDAAGNSLQRSFSSHERYARAQRMLRATSNLVQASIVAALLVVADQAIDLWADGNVLHAWLVLWLLAFAWLALLATPVRRLAAAILAITRLRHDGGDGAQRDQSYWNLALMDPRIMADIRGAETGQEESMLASVGPGTFLLSLVRGPGVGRL